MRQWVFGYASLVHDYAGDDSVVCQLRHYRRVWGVAADNSRTIPGYKIYRDRRDGSRPAVYVAFIDVAPHAGATVEGLAFPVDSSTLALLDTRELNYDRTDVTAAMTGIQGADRVWTYIGSSDGRARLRSGCDSGTAVVSRDYADKVHAGFRALGDDHYERFLASSDLDDLPLWDLDRLAA